MKDLERYTFLLQRELEKIVKERRIRKKLIYLGKSRSFKEFLFRKLHYVVYDMLADKGVSRWEALRYFNFAKFCFSRALTDGIKYIDQIFDLAEEKFIERDGLKPELVRDLEVLLINYIHDIPRFEEEFERVKLWYQRYKEEVQRNKKVYGTL